MKAIVIKEQYGLDHITLEEKSIPEIGPKEVLVKTTAMTLNQLDLMIAKGDFGTALPHVLGSDAVGVVEKIGAGVSLFNVGDVVIPQFIQSWQSGKLTKEQQTTRLGTDRPGVFSEYWALPEEGLVKIPKNLTPAEAATLPIAGLSAWEALYTKGNIQAGQTILLQGTGGVSIFALQFAKLAGARVIITSGSDEKLSKAKLLGADATINSTTHPNWQEQVLELTGGKGVDLAVELSWTGIDKTITAMAMGGKIIVVGLLGGADTSVNVYGIMLKCLSIIGLQVGSKASFEAMNRAIENNNLKPVIDRTFPFSAFKEAFHYVAGGHHFGKVVIQL